MWKSVERTPKKTTSYQYKLYSAKNWPQIIQGIQIMLCNNYYYYYYYLFFYYYYYYYFE
jgi:hypothetical protein